MVEVGYWLPVVAVISPGDTVPAAVFGHIVTGAEAADLLNGLGRIARELRNRE